MFMSYSDSLIYGDSLRETKGKPQKWFVMRIIFIVLLRIHLQQKKKIVRLFANLRSTSQIHHLPPSLLLLISFICTFTDENQWVLKVRRDLLGSNARFASEALDSASGDSRLFQALGEQVLPVKCWVWVSVTKWRDAKCGLGGCDSPLSPWLWLWPWPLPLLCLQVGGWSRFHEGDA